MVSLNNCSLFVKNVQQSTVIHTRYSNNRYVLAAVDYRSIWKPKQIAALNVQARLCRDVVLLRLFPSIRKIWEYFLKIFFWPQKHIMEALFLRFWDFTIFLGCSYI